MRVRRSRLSDEQTRRLLEHFVAGTPARTAAELVHVNRNTARLFYHKMRELIAQRLESESPLEGEVAVESAPEDAAPDTEIAPGRPRKIPVFALVKRGDKVLAVMLPGAQAESQPTAPKARVRPDSIVYTEVPEEVTGALDVSDFRHERVPRRARHAHGPARISSIESFWSQAKRHLRRYNGVPRQHFHLFLKECEWRFNYGPPKQLLRILKHWIKGQARKSRSMPGQ